MVANPAMYCRKPASDAPSTTFSTFCSNLFTSAVGAHVFQYAFIFFFTVRNHCLRHGIMLLSVTMPFNRLIVLSEMHQSPCTCVFTRSWSINWLLMIPAPGNEMCRRSHSRRPTCDSSDVTLLDMLFVHAPRCFNKFLHN